MNDSTRSSTFHQQAGLRLTGIVVVLLLLPAGADRSVSAQEYGGLQPGQQPTPEQIERFRQMRRGRGNRNQPQPPSAKPEEKKPEEKKEEKKDDEKKEAIKTIKRPTDGSGRLDPDRMRLKPDANGLLQFNYSGQPWAEVLQEFADAANLSFDWQELPADNLNLVTQRKYTLDQARDLLNRHLLARGFTLIRQGEVLTAVKVDKLDPSLVPRVEADELEDYPPHDFVRVRFQLPHSMEPSKASEDVKILLSPNAKVTPLLNTKQLLVIDSVANLRSVRDLIYAEQSAADSIIKPVIFQIKHQRAGYVADQVMIVLGLDPASRKSPQELQLETQKIQLYKQMQQKGKDVSKLLQPDGPKVYIAEDRTSNRLFINAPPELMPTIERTIEAFDQPESGAVVAGDPNKRTMRRHKTTSSPDAIVSALVDMGTLDPRAQLQTDSKSKTIFAFATPEDHKKIEQLIGKLDGSGRGMKVIWLRRLPARQVAGTINALLVGEPEKEEEDDSRRRRRFFGFGFGNQEEEKKEVGFKAMPDVENNRLILWANADEIAEVEKLLVELGEKIGGEARNPNKVRVLSPRSPEETARLLEQLKAAYPGKLNIHAAEPKPTSKESAPEAKDRVTHQTLPTGKSRGQFYLTQLEAPASEEAPAATTNKEAPPVNIVIGDDGQLVISSDDPAALDQLEDLLAAIEPPQKEYEVFQLKYASASRVLGNLEEYFAEELKDQTESVFDEWGQYEGRREKDLGPTTLGRRQLLRFVYDYYSNTILVQGASPSQLAVIKRLIDVYDQAPKPKDFYARRTEVIQLKYSRAQDIANSLKEVYRELLSSKDKEFQDDEGGSSGMVGQSLNYVFGEVRKNEDGEDEPVIIKFDGVLSIGVDQVSNAVIISAREEVLEDIKKTVHLLDQAALPDTEIRVHRVRGTLPASQLQKMLKGTMSAPWPGGKPLQSAQPNAGRSNQQQSDRGRERVRGRSRRGRGR